MNILNEGIKKKIISYMQEDETVERCGLVVESGGFQKFIPCKNIHFSPKDFFMIDQKDFILASMSGEIISVVHSHSKAGLPHLSSADRFAQYHENVMWALYHPDNEGFLTEYPAIPKLKGREFNEGYLDCYDSFRDFYRLAGHEMGSYGPSEGYRIPDWYKEENAESPFLKFIEDEGFERVLHIKDMEEGDVIFSLFGAQVPNHCSVYVGNNQIFHHLPGKLSMVEELRQFYIKYNHSIWRYKKRESLKIEQVINILNSEF